MTSPRRPHPLDALSLDQLSRPVLPDVGLGRRGYDRLVVDKIIADLAEYIDSLRVDLAAASRTLRYREQEIEQRRYGVRLPSAGDIELIHEEQLSWQLEAQRHGDQITAVAQTQAEQIVEDAQLHADRIVASTARLEPASPPGARVEEVRTALRGARELIVRLHQQVDVAGRLADDWVRH